MRCSDAVEWIADKLDGTLPGDRLRELDEHLARCPRCRAELRLQEQIHSALARPVPSVLPADFARLVTERARERTRSGAVRFRWPVVVFSSLLGLGFVSLFLLRSALARVLESAFGPAAAAALTSFRGLGGITLSPGMESLRSLSEGLHQVGVSSGVTPVFLAVVLVALVTTVWASRSMWSFLHD